MNNELKVEFNYNFIISSALTFLIPMFIVGFLVGFATSLIFLGIGIVLVGTQFSYQYFILNEDNLILKPWLGKELIIPTQDIKNISLNLDETFELLTFEVFENDIIKKYRISSKAYEVKNSTDDTLTVIETIKEYAEKYALPFQTADVQTIANIQMGNSLRFIVYPALILFTGMMYVDFTVIAGVHFDTMNFLLSRILIVLLTCFICYLFLKLNKNRNAVLYAIAFGGILGLLFSSVAKTYVHWYDEDNVDEIVQYYPMKLDDYDSYDDKQRWVIESKEAQELIGQKRLFLYGIKRDRIMNNKLVEEKTYSIPVAVGMFNDVFIPKDGFMNAKEVEVVN